MTLFVLGAAAGFGAAIAAMVIILVGFTAICSERPETLEDQ